MKVVCGWIYAIDRYGYPPSLKDTLKALKEMAGLGFRYVEMEGVSIKGLNEHNLLEIAKSRKVIKNLCDSLGIRIVTFLPIIPDLVNLDKKERQKALNLFELGIEIAECFKSDYLYSDSFAPPLQFLGEVPYKEAINFGKEFRVRVDAKFSWQEQWDILVESLSWCNQKAKQAGKKFVVEPRLGEMVSNTDGLLRLVEDINDENFGVLFDTAHLHPQKEILPLSIEKLGRKIYYLHVADSNGVSNEHLPIGAGTVDWEGVFSALEKHGFDGEIGIDIGKVPNLEEEFLRAKKFVEKRLRDGNFGYGHSTAILLP